MKKKKIFIIIGGIVLIIIIGSGGIAFRLINKPQQSNNSTVLAESTNQSALSSTQIQDVISSQNSSLNKSKYKDGTYEASATYNSPEGEENIDVKINLNNNVINNVDVISNGENPTSIHYQNRFSDGISQIVVGKNIEEAYVKGRVNGSSLTGQGFNAAIDKIKQQALSK